MRVFTADRMYGVNQSFRHWRHFLNSLEPQVQARVANCVRLQPSRDADIAPPADLPQVRAPQVAQLLDPILASETPDDWSQPQTLARSRKISDEPRALCLALPTPGNIEKT